VPEGGGTLLDHCALLMGSGIRDGNAHDPRNVPMLLAGGGGGRFARGAHHRFAPSPLCNLYVTLLQVFGLPVERFGDGDRVLPELLAG
jgi:hypothetical protein